MPSNKSATKRAAGYERQVFINCPFDDDYWPLLKAIVFVVHACGFAPRSALENSDASEERLAKILRIIGDCKFSIHDLNRKGPDPVHGHSRFNMPFEMGLCFGAEHYGKREKVILVMETARYDYQKFTSDIAGRDIAHHEDNPDKVILKVRDWLNAQKPKRLLPGADSLRQLYKQFQNELPDTLKEAKINESELGFVDWTHLTGEWLNKSRV